MKAEEGSYIWRPDKREILGELERLAGAKR
jgi:hypothetical protein